MKQAILGFVLTATVLFGLPASAVRDLIPDGGFDAPADVLEWDPALFALTTHSWSDYDAAASSASGSYRIVSAQESPTTQIGALRCFPATAGASYHVGAEVAFPSGQSRFPRTNLVLYWFDAAHPCDPSSTDYFDFEFATGVTASVGGATFDTWIPQSYATTAPPGAASVMLALSTSGGDGTGEAQVHWDDIDLLTDAPISGAEDFTGDGRSDLIWRQPSTGKNVIWAMDGATRLSYGYLLDAPPGWSIVGTGDFNGDGRSDILWRNSSSGQNVVWFMDGMTRTSYASMMTVAGPFQIVGAGDFDGDGDADILWRNPDTGQNVLWTMNGTTRVSYSSLMSVHGSVWQIVGTGDFDKDGDADIVWRNGSTGQNVIWFMNGATRASYASTLTVAGPAWRIQAVADYDGDGDADLFWRNVTTGQNVFWFMEGATRVSYASALTVTDLSFEAQGPK